MEELLKSFWGFAATIVEGAAALLITIGAVEAFAMSLLRFRSPTAQKMQIWMHFATWLLLGLEFELAADVIRTAIAPTWSDIGQLASIAAIRTFLSYFLDRDIKDVSNTRRGSNQDRTETSGPADSPETRKP
jgi:uncharacterized membrane protein